MAAAIVINLVISILAIGSSAASITWTTVQMRKKMNESGPAVTKQLEEIRVLCQVAQECEQMFSASGTVTESIEQCLSQCMDRHAELMAQMAKLEPRSSYRGLIGDTKWKLSAVARETDRKVAYNAFRDCVLLLRDLSSEYAFMNILPVTAHTMLGCGPNDSCCN